MAKQPRKTKPAGAAPGIPHLCATVPPAPVTLSSDVSPMRASAIIDLYYRWANGTVLHYHFVEDSGWDWPDAQKDVVRWAFGVWKGLGIGLEFVETPDASEAEILIGRDLAGGSWSAVGTGSLTYRDRGRTMNFGWDLTTPGAEGPRCTRSATPSASSMRPKIPMPGSCGTRTASTPHFPALQTIGSARKSTTTSSRS